MNKEYVLYGKLCTLEQIAGQYEQGRQHCERIHRTGDQITTQTYRVAVIGEFKRGKSSLINALIGSKVLPTDILPMTAAVTRVIYGETRKILIHFKDGHAEERTLDELFDYATKFDAGRERTAQSVREIEVSYPSVLCKNHIQILDTPGLNDNESMSAVTLSVIGDVDAAIVVTSAKQPMSISEQELTLDLIAQPGVRHIVFVASYIDAFDDEEDKDRILAFIRGRLREDLLDRAAETFSDKPELLEKARGILTEPDLFGVSSRQAMEAFTHDNAELLKKSRFPKFKEELLAYLTAAQSADLPPKTLEIAKLVEGGLPGWLEAERQSLLNRKNELQTQLAGLAGFRIKIQEQMTGLFLKMDKTLEDFRKKNLYQSQDLEQKASQAFIRELTQIQPQFADETHVRIAVLTALNNANTALSEASTAIRQAVVGNMGNVEKAIRDGRKAAGLTAGESGDQMWGLKSWRQENPFPVFQWCQSPLPPEGELGSMNVMKYIWPVVRRSVADYERKLRRHIGSWRVQLMERGKADSQQSETLFQQRSEELASVEKRASALQYNYEQHMDQVRDIRDSLQGL